MRGGVGAAAMNACPACGGMALECAATFPFEDLRRLWFERVGLDISTCLAQPYAEADVVLTRCRTCLLEFFPPALCGTAALYTHLGQFDYYYQDDKWECRAALDVLPAPPARVLEVGCGPGRFLDRLRARYPMAQAVGLELNSRAVAEGRARGHDVRLASLGAVAASEPGAYDVLFAFQVLEHLPEPGQFLREAAASLSAGGWLIVAVPNAHGFTGQAVNDFGNLPPHHLSRWHTAVFERVAPAHGLLLRAAHEEPVAPYHREWYRTLAILKRLSFVAGRRWRPVELGTGFRVLQSLADRCQRHLPARLWRYRRPGHTLLAVLQKAA